MGQSVVARLIDAGREVRVLARRQRDAQPQVTFFTGDLRRGEGIDAAVRGAGVIINCATSTKGDAEVTTNLVTAAAKAGSPHFVQPSIVGIDAMAQWGYVKTKLEVERIVENCGLPWTILRVTQFYSYCVENSRKLAKVPLVAPVPGGFRVQPVDSREVAARLVELALGEAVGRAPDMAGPEISSWNDLFRSYLAATHQRKLVIPVPVPGSKAVRNGALLPPPGHIEGVKTWDQFLDEELQEFRGGRDSNRPGAGSRR
ncbi:MAG TPA: NAD(P)H-binding protein [Trebonia sp.]|nr:NAD(P)H-binding protein [Trebonia sp.]